MEIQPAMHCSAMQQATASSLCTFANIFILLFGEYISPFNIIKIYYHIFAYFFLLCLFYEVIADLFLFSLFPFSQLLLLRCTLLFSSVHHCHYAYILSFIPICFELFFVHCTVPSLAFLGLHLRSTDERREICIKASFFVL